MNYRPYSCPYVGGSTRYATGVTATATGTGERPPIPPYGLHGVGMGSLGVPRAERTK
ncbi:hypothetical protein [Streptomyces sp. NPDC101455]|uniref:hypothetical protein n=1 Tax=Streptomyces sp. NPDC101455 TaxID=3366142 RepID=UPI0037F94A5D